MPKMHTDVEYTCESSTMTAAEMKQAEAIMLTPEYIQEHTKMTNDLAKRHSTKHGQPTDFSVTGAIKGVRHAA
jgi:phage regulator Rha-like protein